MLHVARLLVAALVAAALTVAGTSLTSPALGAPTTPPPARTGMGTTQQLDDFENRILARINRARARHDLERVHVLQRCVDQTAERWARHLGRSGDLRHRDQTKVLDRCDLAWAGETLVRGTALTPRAAVRAWLRSPSHRAVILKHRARWAGLGARVDDQGRVVAVLNFGDPG